MNTTTKTTSKAAAAAANGVRGVTSVFWRIRNKNGIKGNSNVNINLSRKYCANTINNNTYVRNKNRFQVGFSSLSHDHPDHTRQYTHRQFSVSNYEFPMRDEAPVVTRALASSDKTATMIETTGSTVTASTTSNKNMKKRYLSDPSIASITNDPFDDNTQSLNLKDRESILKVQKNTLSTSLSPSSSHPITPNPPSFIPPNLPRESMIEPQTLLSTLPNGIRVASQETYGQVCTIGLLSECGSRLETNETCGINHMMELLAFSGTSGGKSGTLSAADFQTTMENLGGVSFASSSREQFLYCADVLRPNSEKAMTLLADAVLHPILDENTINDAKQVIEYQWMDIMPEIRVGEGLQMAGYGKLDGIEQQLGRPHFCPLEALPNLTVESIQNFRKSYLLNPQSMVIAGAGIEHNELVELAQSTFGHITPSKMNSAKASKILPSTYTGGDYRLSTPTIDGFVRVALAFPIDGWHSQDLVPACVLQTLLGGGSSFSAGGPGKGMYSRLYRQVLNRYYWAESAEAFTSFHNEAGLLGISGSTTPDKTNDLTQVLAEHFMKLVVEDVTDEELSRARNMLKCNVLTQLESRLVLFEDLGRQILTYGKRETSQDMCAKIEAVTKEDIRNVAKKAVLHNPPTLSSVGATIDNVPHHEEVKRWFTRM